MRWGTDEMGTYCRIDRRSLPTNECAVWYKYTHRGLRLIDIEAPRYNVESHFRDPVRILEVQGCLNIRTRLWMELTLNMENTVPWHFLVHVYIASLQLCLK